VVIVVLIVLPAISVSRRSGCESVSSVGRHGYHGVNAAATHRQLKCASANVMLLCGRRRRPRTASSSRHAAPVRRDRCNRRTATSVRPHRRRSNGSRCPARTRGSPRPVRGLASMVRTSFPWVQHDLPQRYSKKARLAGNPQFRCTAARETMAHTRGWRRQPKDMQRTVPQCSVQPLPITSRCKVRIVGDASVARGPARSSSRCQTASNHRTASQHRRARLQTPADSIPHWRFWNSQRLPSSR